MEVDPSKINLSEKDIEDWLWENPQILKVGYNHRLTGWLGRQIRVPNGIIDLLGYVNSGNWIQPVIVELKNTPFTQASILQVCRYAADIDLVLLRNSGKENFRWINPVKFVIGKGSPNNQIQQEADAVNVNLISFELNYELSLSGMWGFTEEYRNRVSEELDNLSMSDLFPNIPPQDYEQVPEEFTKFIDDIKEE